MSEQLKKRKVDTCCQQEVRWRGQEARFVGIRRRRNKLWWSRNNDGLGVGILVKEQLYEKVVEVLRKSDRVMAMVRVFEEKVITVIWVYAPQGGRSENEKDQFYNDMASE